MGLLDKLKIGGSGFSKYGVDTPPVNPGATKQSKLHAFGNLPGYSMDGAYRSEVTNAYVSYDDGYNNALPQPSQLDLNSSAASLKYNEARPE
jgi:hypothetical protein